VSLRTRSVLVAACLGLLAACGGSSGGSGSGACVGNCSPVSNVLSIADVQRVIAQAVGEAQARGVRAQIAVVDRVGNVLATYEMSGAPATIAITSGLGVTGGIDGIPAGTVPASLSAIAKAITGAYLSSQGNAFSTRSAGQIVQEHFNPNEAHQPSGPLYGVQFSQLSCSDVNRNTGHGSVGPKRSPLGLSADPGGLPLYKNGVLVGGVGIEANGVYGFDRDITDVDENDEELVAVAGATGFAAPADIRAERITADGRTFRFADSESLRSNPASAPSFASLPGALVAVAGYSTSSIVPGTAFGTPASGIRPDTGTFAAAGGWVLVDASNANRFPPIASTAGPPGAVLGAEDVRALLAEALAVAQRARAQIRRPLGSSAQVTISVVDRIGDILGVVRTGDGPIFGIDVAVQKARTALFFSSTPEADLAFAGPASYLTATQPFRTLTQYSADLGTFIGESGAYSGKYAFSTRAIGNLHRPFYPDGLENSPRGPLSTPIEGWSPFNVGLQLDVIHNQLVRGILGSTSEGCAGRPPPQTGPGNVYDTSLIRLRNGMQIFPGGMPIYMNGGVIGAIGVSGDGVDQDDMVGYLAIENASRIRANGFGHAPPARRADVLAPLGVRLRYVQCPQAPFNDSTEQNVCS
jgi:uncharacterized protein GlcG (DUF336 family)